ncbi:cysteine proteinase COT44-like [Centruroides sculpturatus]|uniref:cysteine proteinase COT44-like n=1 Tax=Centruroides sculpturatus TaxID=218467 RepID=UPI000C6EB40B|nr:cysteine proteinase COT44-like [Centruroides sculpturatus]
MTGSSCRNTNDDLDHSVLAVGYGELFGEKYWLVKNSWSTYWGNDGYFLLSQKDNNCGAATNQLVNLTLEILSINTRSRRINFIISHYFARNTNDDLDHSVLAVGYGELFGEKYWLVKNSWSTYWGNDGYFLLSQKDNNCGAATEPTFVVLTDDTQ